MHVLLTKPNSEDGTLTEALPWDMIVAEDKSLEDIQKIDLNMVHTTENICPKKDVSQGISILHFVSFSMPKTHPVALPVKTIFARVASARAAGNDYVDLTEYTGTKAFDITLENH